MKRKLLISFILFFSMKLLAQHPLNMEKYADSLYTVLKTTNNDSIKASVYFNLVTLLAATDSVKAIKFLQKGKELGGKSIFFNGVYNAKLGYLNYYKQDFEKSKKDYLKSDSLLQKVHHIEAYKLLADIWNNVGVMEQINDDDESYIDILLTKCIPYAEKANDKNRLSSLYISVGLCFMNLEQNNKAVPYFKKAETILMGNKKQQFRLVSLYNRSAENYLILNNIPEAKNILDKAEIIFKNNPESEQIALFYMVKGIYFKKIKNYSKAIDAFNTALAKVNGPNKIYHNHEIKSNTLELLMDIKKYDDALGVALELENDVLYMEMDLNKMLVYKTLSVIYKDKGKLDLAYDYLKKYSDLNTAYHESDFKNKINKLENKFNLQVKERELINLKNQQNKAYLELKNNRLYLSLAFAGMMVFLLISLLIFVYYKNNKKALVQKEIIHTQKIAEAEVERKLSITKAILEGQENERSRVAKDLHDGLGGILAGVSLKFSAWGNKYLKEDGKVDFYKNKEQLDGAITELRNISRNLMPESLLNFGLKTALVDLCGFHQSAKLAIDFQWYVENTNFQLNTQLNIYRIIQELLANTIKHAEATQVLLQCTQNEDHFYITVEDNGKGYDSNSNTDVKYKGMGLQNIVNRVAFLNGKMEVISAVNQGTTINIEIDLKSLENA